jgi:BirA family biotin operon repressor/biotin-[acetyl-CoA-carboxylase] ligase
MPADLDPGAVLATLSAAGLPYTDVEIRDSVGSTNAELRLDPRPWRVVVADEQVAGRGRLDRSWSTPPGVALAVSVLLPPVPDAAWVPLLTGLAVRRVVADVARVETTLKWPNDVLVPGDGDRKVCGILCEMLPEGVLVGTGINVSQTREQLPVDTATSLALAGARDLDRQRLLTAFLQRMHAVHGQALRPGSQRAEYAAACSTIGRRVVVERTGASPFEMDVHGVDASGRLVGSETLRRDVVVVAAGDVVHVRAQE